MNAANETDANVLEQMVQALGVETLNQETQISWQMERDLCAIIDFVNIQIETLNNQNAITSSDIQDVDSEIAILNQLSLAFRWKEEVSAQIHKLLDGFLLWKSRIVKTTGADDFGGMKIFYNIRQQ